MPRGISKRQLEHLVVQVCDDTFWNYFPPILYHCPALLHLPTHASHSVTSRTFCIAYASSAGWGPQDPRRKSGRNCTVYGVHRQYWIQATENWDLWIVPVATRVAREVFYQFNVIIESYLIGPDLDPAVTPSHGDSESSVMFHLNWTVQFAGCLSRKNSWSLCIQVSGSSWLLTFKWLPC